MHMPTDEHEMNNMLSLGSCHDLHIVSRPKCAAALSSSNGKGVKMLNVRRFFQDDDSPIEIHISATTPANQDTPAVNPSSKNIHMIEFYHRRGEKNEERGKKGEERREERRRKEKRRRRGKKGEEGERR